MIKLYFTIASTLFFGLLSCSNEESKTQNQIASRPTVPIQNGAVQIGSQVWMTKNLNVSRYRNGDPIPQVTDWTQWGSLTTGAWCYYNFITANGAVYGKLYNWYAVNDPRGLAPAGYHVPSDAEWTTITNYLGGEAVAGGKMKATTLWLAPNFDATNSSGFTALPCGYIFSDGSFQFMGSGCLLWSSTEITTDSEEALIRSLGTDTGGIARYFTDKNIGLSVRCIKN